jgi:hypothetical protein
MFAKRLKRGKWRWCLGFWWGGAARWGDGDENPRGGGHGRQRRLEGRWLPFREAAPWPFFFLGIGAGVQEVLPLLGSCQGREISWLWMDAAKSRVSSQYIEVEVKSWSYVDTPLIQGLLDTSKTFLQLPSVFFMSQSSLALAEIPKNGRSLSQSRHIFSGPETNSVPFSNMATTEASELRLGWLLCLKASA